ncbi:MAG TPA: hypothetical protein VIG97_11505 [Luteimonas sp.]
MSTANERKALKGGRWEATGNKRRCRVCKEFKPVKGSSFRIVSGRGTSTCADCIAKRGESTPKVDA